MVAGRDRNGQKADGGVPVVGRGDVRVYKMLGRGGKGMGGQHVIWLKRPSWLIMMVCPFSSGLPRVAVVDRCSRPPSLGPGATSGEET